MNKKNLNKWDYINMIMKFSDNHENELLNLMDRANKHGFIDITLEEAKEYYEYLRDKK